MAVVYRENPLTAVLKKLPESIYSVLMANLDQEYQLQSMMLRDSMSHKRELQREKRSLTQDAANMGFTANLLPKSEIDSTEHGVQEILKPFMNDIRGNVRRVDAENANITDNINSLMADMATFRRGKQLGMAISDDDAAWSEAEQRSLEASQMYKGLGDDPRARELMQAGASYQDPEYLLGLERTKLDLEAKRAAKVGSPEWQKQQDILRDTPEYEAEQAKVVGTDQWLRAQTMKRKTEVALEGMTYVQRAEAVGYDTIRSIQPEFRMSTANKELAFRESSNIVLEAARMSTFQLDELAEIGATQGGAGYDDVVPAEFDYSDQEAFEAGLRIKAERYLEDKLGLVGYDDEAVDRYVEIFKSGLEGGVRLSEAGIAEPIAGNKDYIKYKTPYAVEQLKSSVAQSIYSSPVVKQLFAQKDQLATTLKSFIFDTTGNVLPGKDWSDVKSAARELGFTKSTYNKTIQELAAVQDTNVLEVLYLQRADIRKLLKLSTEGAAKKLLVDLNRFEAEIEGKMIQTERTMPKDDKDDILKMIMGGSK